MTQAAVVGVDHRINNLGCFDEGHLPVESTFALCCQAQTAQYAQASQVCGGYLSNCTWRVQCRQLLSSKQLLHLQPLLNASCSAVRLAEMRGFFEALVYPYLLQLDTDPIFLDVEHILPQVLLILAATVFTSSSPPTIVDVGAFLGHFSRTAIDIWSGIGSMSAPWPAVSFAPHTGFAAASATGLPPLRVLLLEPSPLLCANLAASFASEGAVAICAAAGAVSGSAELHCPQSSGASLGFTGHADTAACGPPELVRVLALDDLAGELHVAEVALLKVDAEGLDHDVLRGARQLLGEHRVRFVVFEVSELWRLRAEAAAQRDSLAEERLGAQLREALLFLAEVGYLCYLVAPEALVPLSPPWLSDLYTTSEHTFNALCGVREDSALAALVRLFSTQPRAAHFALAALPPADASAPVCWACCRGELGDASMNIAAQEAEAFFSSMLLRVARDAAVPHLRFANGRSLQALGRVEAAQREYEAISAEGWPASLQAQRELHRLRGTALLLLRLAAGEDSSGAAEGSLHLGWLHMRPGSSALFALPHACAAEEWYARASWRGHAAGAFYLGLSKHFGFCTGRMTAAGQSVARKWYRRALRLEDVGISATLAKRLLAALS